MSHQAKFLTAIFLVCSLCISCNAQTKKVGGPCEGCEAIYEYGDKKLSAVDTLPMFSTTEPKLKISGRVFQKDGKTPASDVILYIYQTDRVGIYPKFGDEKGWARRHGFIRGWVKSDAQGKYAFFTFRPAAYPDGTEAEHIHLTVKEPGKNEYYLDDFLFEDDPKLSLAKRQKLENRGGSGILKLTFGGKIMEAKRHIILGLNIPDYE